MLLGTWASDSFPPVRGPGARERGRNAAVPGTGAARKAALERTSGRISGRLSGEPPGAGPADVAAPVPVSTSPFSAAPSSPRRFRPRWAGLLPRRMGRAEVPVS